MKRGILAVLAFTLAAGCTPPAQQTSEPTNDHDQAQSDPLVLALTPVLSENVGQPVRLSVETRAIQGEWGWLVGQPWTPDGAQIDWSQTRYAERAREGVLDGNGTTYALLKHEAGQWRVVEFAVGPTDVAWAGWAERHGAPAGLMQTE